MDSSEFFNLKDTLSCGQCFRFSEQNGVWTVKAGVDENLKVLSVRQEDIDLIYEDPFWSHFFDLETNYSDLVDKFSKLSPIMEKACNYAPGIRILNQDSWEALCSFVVSQNNNIKRIMSIIDRMCNFYGINGGFPSSKTLADAKEDDLRRLGLGFRAPYIVNVARAAEDGIIDEISKVDVDSARKILMTVKGIGPKVANCALLFGCHRLECFPMDTWMKKVMSTYFNGQDGSVFGPYAGVAQQYLFHWARTSEESEL